MHKIDTDTSVDSEFTDGVPESGQPATRLNAKWFNTIQRELCNLLTKFGVALSETNDQQIYDLLKNSIGGNFDSLKATSILVDGPQIKTSVEHDSISVESKLNNRKSVLRAGGLGIYDEEGDQASYLSLDKLILNGGTFEFDAMTSRFKIDKSLIMRIDDEAGSQGISFNLSKDNAFFYVSDNNGQSSKFSKINVNGVETTGFGKFNTINVGDGASSFEGRVSFNAGVDVRTSINMIDANGTVQCQIIPTINGLQFSRGFTVSGVLSTNLSGSIGNGGSSIVPRKYEAGSNGSISVTLKDGEFCFVHKNKPSSGVVNTIAITETSSSASTTFTGSSNEMCVIVYRFGNKIFANALY